MAVNANLTTFPGAMMSPQDFAIMVEKISSQQTGILYGCTATSSGGSTINVASGWALVKGRLVQIDAGSMAIELPTSTVSRYLYIKIDLSNSDIPCSVVVENSQKTDSTDFNVTDGTAYCLLATLTVTASGITNVSNASVITSAEDAVNNLKNADTTLAGSIATIETSPATANHAVGEYIVYNGQLYRVTSAITAGTTLTGKISAASVGNTLNTLDKAAVQVVQTQVALPATVTVAANNVAKVLDNVDLRTLTRMALDPVPSSGTLIAFMVLWTNGSICVPVDVLVNDGLATLSLRNPTSYNANVSSARLLVIYTL